MVLTFLFANATTVRLNPRLNINSFNQLALFVGKFLARNKTALAPWINKHLTYLSPLLLIPNNFDLPPEECCLGTKPKYAANSLPFLKMLILPISAVIAVAVNGPIPGN